MPQTIKDQFDVKVLSREAVERLASIFGSSSAAAQALACVEHEHDGQAEVCQVIGASTLLVIPHTDLAEAGWRP